MVHRTKTAKGITALGQISCAFFMLFLLSPLAWAVYPSVASAATDSMGQDPCPDQVIAQAYRDAPKSAYLTGVEAMTNVFKETLEAEEEQNRSGNPIVDLHPLGAYCIDTISGYFDVADALMDGAAWISKYIRDVVTKLLNAPCTYIMSAVKSAISTVLNAVCIPISLPSFSMTLPSSNGGKSCNGLSLADITTVNIVRAARMTAPIPKNFLSAPMARFIDATGIGSLSGSFVGVNPVRF